MNDNIASHECFRWRHVIPDFLVLKIVIAESQIQQFHFELQVFYHEQERKFSLADHIIADLGLQ